MCEEFIIRTPYGTAYEVDVFEVNRSYLYGVGERVLYEFKGRGFRINDDSRGSIPGIKKIIFNDPATIVFWKDNTKTVVQCGDLDIFDPEKGLSMAIAKKALGNKGNYYETIKKWLPEDLA